MNCVPIPAETVIELNRTEQAGLGYRLVSVELHDGRIFDPIVVSEGCVIQVQGYEEIPFVPSAIRSIKPSQKRWNFRRSYKGQDVLRRAASA